mmetsp:Transcript_32141/g.66225  ORF Transcript_32141/g.66225 Transcript_32141/m.66225 type:complete len:301 (-) Transcript_32141:137-1039(-)|eukprot:s1683_g20.t1
MSKTAPNDVEEDSLEHSRRPQDPAWDWGDRAVYAAHVFWMLKEVGWVLLIPEISLPMGAAAAGLTLAGVGLHCSQRGFAELVLELVMTIWLCTNVFWMTSEVIYDEPDVKFPWSLSPLLPENKPVYSTMEYMSSIGFFIAVAIYLLGLGVITFWYVHPKYQLPSSTFASFLLQSYLCSWCLKDFFWAQERFWPAIFTDLITVPMLIVNARLESGGWHKIRRNSWSWAVWSIASAVWITGELKFPGVAIFNYVTGALLFAAFVMLASSYEHYKAAELRRSSSMCETDSSDNTDYTSDESKA